MKCDICDKDMSDKEIVYNKELGEFEPCGTCLEIIMETAYSDGFARSDDPDDVLVDEDWDSLDDYEYETARRHEEYDG